MTYSKNTTSTSATPHAPDEPFVQLDDITLRVGNELLFAHTHWEIKSDQHWAIIGPNGSGKSILAKAIFRKMPLVRGRILYFFDRDDRHVGPGRSYFNRGEVVQVSAESHSQLMRQQSSYHQARWQSIEGQDSPTVSELLTGASIERISAYDVSPLKVSEAVYGKRRQKALDLLGIEYLLARKLLHLSNGETRKVLIARALMQSPRLLILDDPYLGLDYASRQALQRAIDDLLAAGNPQVLLITPRLEEIPPGISHILQVADCRVVDQGPRHKILPAETGRANFSPPLQADLPPSLSFPNLNEPEPNRFQASVSKSLPKKQEYDRLGPNLDEPEPNRSQTSAPKSLPKKQEIHGLGPNASSGPETRYPVLVDMKNTSVTYGDTTVLHNINWTMKRGENWAVWGANGAGKTTLLSLILADNPQAYANPITLFGKKRGSGESVWDIKRKIGWVSPELQAYHQKGTTCLNVVCSGFFDSIGLYQTCSPEQIGIANHWLRSFGVLDLADRPLGTVSAGEQRLVLLARALVKNPILLILDEPCQGLDFSHRTRIIALLDRLCRQTSVNLIYVTHHFDEMPRAITHVLKLDRGQVQVCGPRK